MPSGARIDSPRATLLLRGCEIRSEACRRGGDTPASPIYSNLGKSLDRPISSYAVDPVRNPYAPGAGQRPPELAGRDGELAQFEIVLERVARGRPERSMVLTGLRGVGKTVLLNAFRSIAMQRLC